MKTKGIVVGDKSSNFALSLEAIEIPEPKYNEVVLAVKSAGVNRADLAQRVGKYPPPAGASPILGMEVSGVIKGIGPGVVDWKIGEEVYTLLSGGGYAEHVVCPTLLLAKKTDTFTFDEAAAFPEAVFTAFVNLIIEGQLAVGERVLIQGGSSGVGTIAVQIAQRMGAEVIATAGSNERCRLVKELGAHKCINYKMEDLALLPPFDVILDIVGGPLLSRHVSLLKKGGRIICIATQGGKNGELDILELMRRGGRIIGSTLRSRTVEEKAEIKSKLDLLLGGFILRKEIRPVIDSVFPLIEVEKAHQRMEEGMHFGKIVLKVN